MRFGSKGILLGLLIIAGGALPVAAEDAGFTYLGNGRLLNDDVIGDGEDRWRTGSYSISVLYGSEWQGDLTSRPLDVIEFRLRGEAIAPANVTTPALNDRLYACVLAFGVHSHCNWRGADIAMGADILGIGPQTGIRELQRDLHEALIQPVVNAGNRELQNKTLLDLSFEANNEYAISEGAYLRPFLGLTYGSEDLARVGFDLTLGQWGQNGLRLRDPIRASGLVVSPLSRTMGYLWSWVRIGPMWIPLNTYPRAMVLMHKMSVTAYAGVCTMAKTATPPFMG